MATRSVHEHPGRFLVAILEGLIDKLLNKKTIVAMQACWGYQEFGPNDPICGPYQLSPL